VVCGGDSVQSHPTGSVAIDGLHASSQYWSSVLENFMPVGGRGRSGRAWEGATGGGRGSTSEDEGEDEA